MRFIIQRELLNELVNKLQSIVPPKPTVPLLGNLLIEASNDELVISASDLTVGMRSFVEAEIIEEGSTTLPAKKFVQLLREINPSQIEISTGSNQITTIKAGGSRFKLNGMDPSSFPDMPTLAGAFAFKILQRDLKQLLSSVSFAVSKEENRHTLTGVLMQIKESEITVFGTDGKRLARSTLKLEIDPSYSSESIIPIKAVEEITRSLKEEGEATLSLLHDKIGVEFNHTLMVTKLLSGDYPDLNRLLEGRNAFSIILHREELTSLLRQVALFTEDISHSARFVFNESELSLSANKPTIGEGNTSMSVHYEGPRFEIAFNPTFFLDILRHCESEVIKMCLVDSYNPGIITAVEEEEKIKGISSIYLLMPMRLSED